MKEYRKESWLDPRVEVRPSSKGLGMFAKSPIKKDEVVVIWGGQIFTNAEKEIGLVKKYTASRIDENHWLGSPLDAPDVPDQYLNHSCEPNVWLMDEVTLVTRRDIDRGEEITADYSTWSIDETWVMDESCKCGSPLCRHRITGKDWKLKELQERYKGHFVPFINKIINKPQ
ncbi:MAG: SET domain-containing protein-lysine N-methyltransferase [Nanoarchaeota archaeon]